MIFLAKDFWVEGEGPKISPFDFLPKSFFEGREGVPHICPYAEEVFHCHLPLPQNWIIMSGEKGTGLNLPKYVFDVVFAECFINVEYKCVLTNIDSIKGTCEQI